jgi:hypothetical protein
MAEPSTNPPTDLENPDAIEPHPVCGPPAARGGREVEPVVVPIVDERGRLGGACLLMVPVLVFFGVATLVGCLIRVIVGLRLRAVARQPEVSDGDLCELKQANRISSFAAIASLAGLAVVGLAYVAFWLS